MNIFYLMTPISFVIFSGGNEKSANDVNNEANQSVTTTTNKPNDESKDNSTEKNSSNNHYVENNPVANTNPSNTAPPTSSKPSNVAPTQAPTDEHWICDSYGVYLWNPEPSGDESISWSGGYVTDGEYKYADGKGTVTWYRDGEVIQVDNGGFSNGRHHGHFVHKFPSGKVIHSNWDHGRELE